MSSTAPQRLRGARRNPGPAPRTTRAALHARWDALQPRERLALAAAGILLAAGLVWLAALAPALAVLRQAPAQIEQLEGQHRLMELLAQEAQALRERAGARPADAHAALADTTRNVLGPRAQLGGTGEQAQVRLEQVRPDELLDWLAQVRSNARTTPAEAELKAGGEGLWGGTVSFSLPPPGE